MHWAEEWLLQVSVLLQDGLTDTSKGAQSMGPLESGSIKQVQPQLDNMMYTPLQQPAVTDSEHHFLQR